ncbi:MAG: hypothetical protein GC182_14480 [Rhodopseudomonas sp.]|nr:hypothetical protein [Rhodopseudomonas sp.]
MTAVSAPLAGALAAPVDWLTFTPPPQGFAERLCVVPNILPQPAFAALAAEIERFVGTERNYVPTHKKGGTIAYETLRTRAPRVAAFYQSPALHRFISDIVGVEVGPTPLHDQSSLSVLFYERPGDHIGWHYDHNFYKGRHFTVLLPIVNRGANDGLSAAKLMVRKGRDETIVETPPDTLIVFEGARVLHKVTPIEEGERRIVLSMTFCADNRHSMLQEAMRRVKDTAFFGPRALWS